ncbi:pyridoxamine 5'-phosphate oxidase family protein [Actinospica robiniae]|uniref:pyridoxamine 5'-phosphate oxidase family protein n=1 Tax=Actinospica robiniae TaxID=304901 RepID=UPI00054E3383
MAERFDDITPKIRTFIDKQHMFFVATAPLGDGRVNVSPKGYKDTFKVIDEHTFAYLELFGSGIETKAHLGDNPRITIMFCSFGRESNIVRLYGKGRYLRPDDPEFERLAPQFNLAHPSPRGIVVVDVESTQTSCGYAVPYMEIQSERPVLDTYHERRTAPEWARRVAEVNDKSIDGLPGLEPDHPLPTDVRRRPAA